MSYEERMAALGIDRGALAPGAKFKAEYGENNAIGKEPMYLRERASQKITAAGLAAQGVECEDLSHLNHPGFRNYQKAARAWRTKPA